MKIVNQFIITFLLFLFSLFWFCLPSPLFKDTPSDILLSSDSTLMGARISDDQQWRFPEMRQIPEKLEKSILCFEDRRFYMHPGVDPLAISRAIRINLQQARVVSGGSTITMQLIRLSRKGRKRTFSEKIIEAILAFRLELTHSKQEILSCYLTHAPFGGNTVGAEAASWRYFSRSPETLSWAEAALLAVLPNSPALIHPGRNRESLRKKRNHLLAELYRTGEIDELTYSLSLDEPVPEQPAPLPALAPHLLDRFRKKNMKGRIYSTLDVNLQKQTLAIANRYASRYQSNHIYNMGILVVENATGHVLSYVGNPSVLSDQQQGMHVDMVFGERSTGSLLKPILYAAMLDAGQLLPSTLIPDIPLYVNGFSPRNYNKEFYGAVPASQAISRSLNVPLVRMLMTYDYVRFYDLLTQCGMNTLHRLPGHYGLSLILGGAEGTLWNLTSVYASLARILLDEQNSWQIPLAVMKSSDNATNANPPISKSALWFMVEAMSELNRPEEESDWQSFSGMKKIAWKTGTSYGARDAWAIGFTPGHTVGVWVGNASGEGRAGLSGVEYAAPVLFDVFSHLPQTGWFESPRDQLKEIIVCRESGFRAGMYCTIRDTIPLPVSGQQTSLCPYHHRLNLDETGCYRVNADCYPTARMIQENRFILPPAQEFYFRLHNPSYQPLPPMLPACQDYENRIEIIYPRHNMCLYPPVGFNKQAEKMVFRAAHSRQDATVFWYIGETYYGETQGNHQMAFSLDPGRYLLTVMDETGSSRKIMFTVMGK
ncbi:MAG: penicillin-binding protein 1C [Bacteroidales bacterium]